MEILGRMYLSDNVFPTCRANMVMPRTQSLITFPVEISKPGTMEALQETHWLAFACQLLETKLLQLMRFKFGEVRT